MDSANGIIWPGVHAVGSARVESTTSRLRARPLCFSILATSIIFSKVVHLYAHRDAIAPLRLLLWSTTFFFQDVVAMLLARVLTAEAPRGILRIVATALSGVLSLGILCMASANIAFFFVTGAEIHWRHITNFPTDAAGIRTLLSESTAFAIALAPIAAAAIMLTPYTYSATGRLIDYLTFATTKHAKFPSSRQCIEDDTESASLKQRLHPTEEATANQSTDPIERFRRHLPIVLLVLLQALQPHEFAYRDLATTLPLSPLPDIFRRNSIDWAGRAERNYFSDQCGSLTAPPKFDWLPSDPLAGFEDWYPNSNGTQPLHYDPKKDCLHISNLENDLLEPISAAIRDRGVKVKHIILVKLESTRKDAFPLTKGNFLWNRIAESHKGRRMPIETEKSLSELTRTAEYLTGDDGGFDRHNETRQPRGGITASNAFSTSSFTLKSVPGTVCGITPVVADFHEEYRHHIYQPCMPHVLEALNQQGGSRNRTEDFKSWPWQSVWMQSITNSFGEQAPQIAALGFKTDISREVLVDSNSAHYPPKSKDINYYGLPETELKPYLRDTIIEAEKNRERLFITHLTSTTHHPWSLAGDYRSEQYLGYTTYGITRKLNRYLNTIGFVDKWLADILSVLEETGIANETLLVMSGDHGINVPFDGSSATYDCAHAGCFHVPLLVSHPALPPIRIEQPVSSMQLVPTVLDLLISSSSLNEAASTAASDVLPFYEGQSLLRPLTNSTDSGRTAWQFSVVSPGSSWMAVHSATASYRLVVPLTNEVGWRFTDLASDPYENDPVLIPDWFDFVRIVRQKHGPRAVAWVEEAAAVAWWKAGQNHRLWRWEG